jgi:TonB family protein
LLLISTPGFLPSARAQKAIEPKPIFRTVPRYPEYLRQHEIGGVVRLSVEITPRGTVGAVRPIGGNPILIDAAVDAVKQWKYAPRETAQTVEVKIDFIPRSLEPR